MDVDHISAGEHALDAGLHVLIDHGAVGAAVHLHIHLPRQFIFWHQTDAQQQGVAGKALFRAGDRAAVGIHRRDRDPLQALLSHDIRHRVGQVQGDVVIPEALDDIAVQAAGIGHQFHAGQNLCALQGHTAGHDQADVAAAEDDDPFPHQISLDIEEALGCSGGKNAGAARAGNGDGAPGAFAAAHGKDHGPRPDGAIAVDGVEEADAFILRDLQDHGIGLCLHTGGFQHFNIAPGIFRPGQFLLEAVQTEAVVDALVQNTAQLAVALQDQNAAQALFPGCIGRSKSGRAAADHNQFIVHAPHLPWSRRSEYSCLPPPASRPPGPCAAPGR